MAEAWSEREVELVVADYFGMLRAELAGEPYSKTQHRRALVQGLDGRREQSVEFKHANISAVLLEMHLPYIDGYKPRGNYQRLLRTAVEEFLVRRPTFLAELADAPRLNPTAAGRPTGVVANPFVEPPERGIVQPSPQSPTAVRNIDFALRDAQNRRLGELGERWVLDVERKRLLELGRDDLASRVEWVSSSRGDGLGFDILSFNHDDDAERWVEVKTTSLGKYFPFYVTSNEVRVSSSAPNAFHLYRVFGFGRDPKLFSLRGPLSETCKLEPTLFRATV